MRLPQQRALAVQRDPVTSEVGRDAAGIRQGHLCAGSAGIPTFLLICPLEKFALVVALACTRVKEPALQRAIWKIWWQKI